MKQKRYLFLLLFLPAVFTSCNYSDSAQSPDALIASTDHIGEQQKTKNSPSLGNKIEERVEINDQDNFTASLEGFWVHEDDSLAFVRIDRAQWVSGYEDQDIEEYSYTVVNELSQFVDPSVNAEFVVLTSQTDTLYYELNGVTKENLSLTWYPEGRVHVYRRKK